MRRYAVLIVMLVFVVSVPVYAEEILLKNGDRISASILNDTKQSMTIQSQALGTITIDRIFVQSPAYDEPQYAAKEQQKQKAKAEWSRKVSLGYNRSGGNTVKSELNTSLSLSRKTDVDELTFRASGYYSSSDRKMDSQKYYGMARYAVSFGEDKHWYNFYKLEVDHDRFADIDYRLLPTVGIGHWFADTEDWKLMAELAGGLEYTDYRSGKDSTSKFTAVPRGYFKKLLLKDLWLEQDLTGYLVADDLGQYRLRSETSLIHQLTEQLSWKLSLIDEYNADPAGSTKANDYRVIYAIDYAF